MRTLGRHMYTLHIQIYIHAVLQIQTRREGGNGIVESNRHHDSDLSFFFVRIIKDKLKFMSETDGFDLNNGLILGDARVILDKNL